LPKSDLTIEYFAAAFLHRLLHDIGASLALLLGGFLFPFLAPRLFLLAFLLCLLLSRNLCLKCSAIMVGEIVLSALLQNLAEHRLVRLRPSLSTIDSLSLSALATLLSTLFALLTGSLLFDLLPQVRPFPALPLLVQAGVQPIWAHDVYLSAIPISFESELDTSDLVFPRLLFYNQVSRVVLVKLFLKHTPGCLDPFLNLFSGPGISGPGTWDDGENPTVAQDFPAHDDCVGDAAKKDVSMELKFLWLSVWYAATAGSENDGWPRLNALVGGMEVRGGWCISVSMFVLCVVVVKDWCSENESYQCITDYEHMQRFIDD
jgi:hypothetical protein